VARIPPGQKVITRLPVLHVGPIPPFDPEKWNLRIFGRVEEEVSFTYQDILQMPVTRVVADVHCVTGWSVLDTVWEGVWPGELLKRVKLLPDARFVLVHSEYGYTTNLPLEVFLDNDVVLAYRLNGAPLPPEHGYPLRLVVPKRYFWKSAKWVRALEFLAEDKPGYWEQRGYHNNADPWQEERFGP